MQIVYSLLLTVAFILLSPVFAWQAIFRRKYLGNLRERLGWLPPGAKTGRKDEAGLVIWLHAVSVGEALSAVPLMTGLRKRFPAARIIVSTTTMTGQAIARERAAAADAVCYFPFDWRFSVRRALDAIRPRVVILMESELWFNFLGECEARGIPVLVANGRISDRSFARSRRVVFFLRRMYGRVARFAMQSPADAERAVALGAPAGRVSVSGNLKYDIEAFETSAKVRELAGALAAQFGLGDAPLLVAGSTHAGEEEPLLAAFRRLNAPGARLLLAPRLVEGLAEDLAQPYPPRATLVRLKGLLLDLACRILSFHLLSFFRHVLPPLKCFTPKPTGTRAGRSTAPDSAICSSNVSLDCL